MDGIKICKDAPKAGIYANKLFKESNLCEFLSVWRMAGSHGSGRNNAITASISIEWSQEVGG